MLSRESYKPSMGVLRAQIDLHNCPSAHTKEWSPDDGC